MRTTAPRPLGGPAAGTTGASTTGVWRCAPELERRVNHAAASAATMNATIPNSTNHFRALSVEVVLAWSCASAYATVGGSCATGCSTVGAKNCSAVEGAATAAAPTAAPPPEAVAVPARVAP